ncbi:FkbM family methyltransferase [uncultured Alsobacter sp.]|uniref:FkbM family methyltransferase n=1 Tax=uncultured Alsobacter sp. TaxID=1748258 RepID=UPI0025D300B1|nr:FkbM family methyltransferase [uncultured Alsobacter sp.]
MTVPPGRPLSYAQNLEDVHIALAFGGRAEGVYVDIGGGHPVADNVTYAAYLQGWRGVVVEPQASLAALHARLRPRDTVLQCVVGRRDGEAAFHAIERFHGLSSIVEDHARSAGERFGAGLVTTTVPMLTLASLARDHCPGGFDVLKIDVEGAEGEVLAGNDWSRVRPTLIVAEAIAPGTNEPAWEGWEPDLLAQGYDFVFFDKLNRFYVAREAPEVAQRLKAAPVAWDSVTHLYEIGRAFEPRHPDHALADVLRRGLWASLPTLDDAMLESLVRAAGADPAAVLPATADERAAALGRIAMGYDGGQIFDDLG